jgi:cyclopropane-fatty-acyl-phospholipid synthase
MPIERQVDNWVRNVTRKMVLPLRIELWNGKRFDLGPSPTVTLRIPQPSALRCLLTPSLYSLGSAYVDEKIDIVGEPEDIIAVGGVLASKSAPEEGKFTRLRRALRRTRAKEAAAISYHYDVSNDFYRLWLDDGMVYSCAYFEEGNEDLGQAQLKKIDHILDKLGISANDSLLVVV